MTVHRGAIACALALGCLAKGAQLNTRNGPAVRMAITEQKFCLGQPGFISREHQPPDAVTFRLRVRLFYRNTGSIALLLPTSHDAVVLLSRSLGDVRRRRNQFDIRLHEKRSLED